MNTIMLPVYGVSSPKRYTSFGVVDLQLMVIIMRVIVSSLHAATTHPKNHSLDRLFFALKIFEVRFFSVSLVILTGH